MQKPEKQLDAPKPPLSQPAKVTLSGQAWQVAQQKIMQLGIGPMRPDEMPDQYYQRIQEALQKSAIFPKMSQGLFEKPPTA